MFRCRICNTVFTHSASLEAHVQIHARVTNLKCRICNRAFRHIAGLRKHMKRHIFSSEKDYQLKDADKRVPEKKRQRRVEASRDAAAAAAGEDVQGGNMNAGLSIESPCIKVGRRKSTDIK